MRRPLETQLEHQDRLADRKDCPVWLVLMILFSCGQNNYGELCLGHCNSTSKLEHVPFFSAKGIRDIAGGNEVLAVVMNDGAIFTCGLNKSGQCGNGTFEERVIIATPVRALSGITINMVAAANG
ncbi:LOW QUALITY PROTEIN: Regulator of chromosome condensation (RCC1)-like protein, partial [Phytophthora palmivora]